jgi:hypothetical protein
MLITLIRNSTGATLQLFDGVTQLGQDLPNGGSIQHVPITITSVTRGGVRFANHQGGFADDQSYTATFTAAPATVSFTPNPGTRAAVTTFT